MQDFLTLAATATLFGTIGFIALGYPLYVWTRTAPIASTALTKVAEPTPQIEPVIEVEPIAVPKATPAQSEPVIADAPATPAKRRGRPRKVSTVTQEVSTTKQRQRKAS